MGKALNPTNPSSTHSFPKKFFIKKKNVKVTIKPNVIDNYLRTLSTNFGSTSLKKATLKRKRETDEISLEKPKKTKLVEEGVGNYNEIVCTYYATINTKFEKQTEFLQSEDDIRDLFHIDEQRNSHEHTLYVDWLFHICDEISLEGLDGITLEALWLRLRHISDFPVLLEGKEEFFWNIMKCISQIEYYILEAPRGKLIIYDRNSCVCPDTGIVLEPVANAEDIYPYSMVNKDGIKGSCSTYNNRLENSDIVRNLSLDDAIKIYGDRLVIVASQMMRENAIISEISNPNLELVDNEYGLLERVGRSRKFGELTQGKVSILSMIKDSRSIFHIRKSLEKKKLLKKQFFILRSLTASQNKTGKLLHLRRFYRIQKSKTLLLIEEVVELLRQKPGYSLEFGEFKKYFPRSSGVNKIMKMPEFNKYIRTDIFRPYRHLYPNATVAEWKYKNKDKEKILRVFQLINPTVNVSACWDSPDNEQNSDDECIDDESPGNKTINAEFLKEVFLFIFNKGKDGVTLQELEKNIELDYYTIRIAIRKLQAKNVIDSVRSEHGKQRHILYFARCFHSKVTRRMPVSKPMGIPDNILQKILQPQSIAITSSLQKECALIFNGDKCLKNLSTLPFQCRAFKMKLETSSKTSMSEEKKILILFKKVPTLNLMSEPISSKFYTSVKRNKRKRWNWMQQDNIIVSYSSEDLTMKIVLLKSVVLGIELNILNMLEGNKNDTIGMQDVTIDFDALTNDRRSIAFKISQTYSKDYLLGPAPLVLYAETTPENVDVTVILSTPPNEYIFDFSSYITFDKNLTPLSLFRTNTILQLVNRSHIICDIYKLQKSMMEIEMEAPDSKPGQGKIDKNTLNRLLLKLATEGYIKIFKLILSSSEKFKTQWLITHPRVEVNHPLLKSAQEQMLVKFFLGMDKTQKIALCNAENSMRSTKSLSSPFDSNEITSSLNKLKEISDVKPTYAYKISRQFGRILGYQPKFVRLQLLHELLFFLIYDYQPLDQMTHNDLKEVLVHYAPEEIREIPPIYKKEIDWKMFIPPLPSHQEWGSGWALLCDVILSIPLSLWVKLFHTSLECPELYAYMEHPIKRHYLIKDVPLEFRQVLMFRRKYLSNAVELVYRLCFIGLVQLGPQSPQVKDQIFLYLNRKTSLLDTSTSGPSYHKITQKNYKIILFTFYSRAQLEDYWCQLWTISMNTSLGQRTVMQGKSVTIENPAYKPALLSALKLKTPQQAQLNDIGEVPGDRQGAAGLDSSMWAHIKRNWLWSSKGSKIISTSRRKEHSIRDANIACIKPVSIKYRELMNHSRKIFLPHEHHRFERIATDNILKKKERSKIIHRKIIHPRKTIKKNHTVDAKDKAIIKRVGKKFRATWTYKEDRILFICKAASYFLFSNSNKELISPSVMRDVLHLLCPNSLDKTTAACIRRVVKLWKTDPVMKRVKDNASNLINVMEVSKYLSPIIFNINRSTGSKCPYTPFELTILYIHLVSYMYQNIVTTEKMLQGHTVTLDYFASDNIHFFSPILVNMEKKKSDYINPHMQDDVEKDVIRSVLLSSLNSSKLGYSTSYQLFKICTKYPDHLIRSAVISLKNSHVISLNKRSKMNSSGIKSMPFQLSMPYSIMQKSTFSTLTMHTIYQNHLEMVGETAKFAEVDPSKSIFKYGRLLARNEIASIWPDIHYLFNIPDSAYILNPYIKDRTVLTTELAIRYQQYLRLQLQEKADELELDQSSENNSLIGKEHSRNVSEKKKSFEMIRMNVTRLLMSLPCLCNKTICANFSPFMEASNEDEFNNYLLLFLESLITVALNLLNTEPSGIRLLHNYMSKFHRSKVIDSASKELEARIIKIGHIVREFLRSHQLTNIKECFENEYAPRKSKTEEIIRAWLDKSKQKSPTVVEDIHSDLAKNSKVNRIFFKFNKSKENENSTKVSFSTQVDEKDKIPEVEDIIKGMMIPPDLKISRTIPHISELACLLSKDKFPEMNRDEVFLEELKNHFITQYPILEGFIINNIDDLKNSSVMKKLFDTEYKEQMQDKILRSILVADPNKPDMIQNIRDKGGDATDIRLAEEIITYVYNKGVLGATGEQLKIFGAKVKNLDLITVLDSLTKNYIFLRTGIAEIVFVHYEFSSSWLVETFHLSPQENHLLHASEKDQLVKLGQKIESRIKSTKQIKVLLMPWIRIDGTLNLPLLEKWLTLILSHCLDFPNCSVNHIFEKYHLVKPVELYFLMEILQDMKCLKVSVNVKPPLNLLSKQAEATSRPATPLDNFRDMYIEVHTLSSTCMGFYLDKESMEFA